jgi:hypothetical protein
MSVSTLKKFLFIPLITLLFFAFLISCDRANEEAEEVVDKSEEIINESEENITEMAEDNTETAEETIDNKFLLGIWTGKFDNRVTTLNIVKQDKYEFEGKITINYRDVINQNVIGNFDPNTNVITMEDQLHSRYKGSYEGKLSEDQTEYSGVFTMKLNNKKYNFNLKKK